jgi:hypothetical protein
MENRMATNGIGAQPRPTRRIGWLISGWAARLLIAFIISWLIVLVFFASGAISR